MKLGPSAVREVGRSPASHTSRRSVEGRSAPIADHAAIGDGRTIALVTRDGSVDWWCVPDLDSASVFGSLLDPQAGGSFRLAPDIPFDLRRRYIPGTNVLETTYVTSTGSVRVTDAMTLPDGGLTPFRELCRRIDVVDGRVPMSWSLDPRFGYGLARTRIEVRDGIPVASAGDLAVAVNAWGVGAPHVGTAAISGSFVAQADATIALSVAVGEPLVFPARPDVERRLRTTTEFWRRWDATSTYAGEWQEAVRRSVLALKLLVFSPSGAVAAAATTSLPERIGGERNWDYRFSWIRDAAFTLSAFLRLGYTHEADAFFWWLMQASQLTHPALDVLYRLDGGVDAGERELPLRGYGGSTPVRVGNAAARQVQLDIYGSLLDAAWTYAGAGRPIDAEIGRRLARIADLVCDRWRRPDSGIWEVRSEPLHFTHSMMMCWVALDRAIRLAELGYLDGASVDRWRAEMTAIAGFVDEACWSDERGSYVRSAGSDEVDAALLLGILFGYRSARDPRMVGTVDAIDRELSDGPFVHRYRADDGLEGTEGAFLPCSFWLIEALARSGRESEARRRMGEVVARANDVGLFAEEIDPRTGTFLGNFPQALTHLALIGAAIALDGEHA